MKIRGARRGDAEVLLKIYVNESFLNGGSEESYNLNDILEYITSKKHKFFVCEYKKKIVGGINIEFFSEYVYLQSIFVVKEFREKGIASALLNKLEDEMKKGGQNFIEGFTEIKNKPMQKLFERRGYSKGKTFYYYSKKL